MDFSKIKDGLGWFGDKVAEAVWGNIYEAASGFMTDAFKLVVNYIVKQTDLKGLFPFDDYLHAMQSIALALLFVAVAWEGVKIQSGGTLGEEYSLQRLIMRVVFATISIFLLPWSVQNFFIKTNNYLVKMINEAGIKIEVGGGIFGVLTAPSKLSQMIVLLFAILAIAFIILSIVAGIRYVELIIISLIAPLVAVSIVRSGDALESWVRETIAVVYTQALQVFLLQLLANIVGKMQDKPLEVFIPAIGVVAVMIMGPQALRKFVYSTGAGSASVRQVGNAGRMAVYKMLASSAIK